MTLNENQILFLQFILREKGIKTDTVQEELIDHISLSIEKKMDKDLLFHDAVDKAFAEFGEENIMAIRQQHKQIVRKKRLRKAALSSCFIFLLSIPSIFMMANHYMNDLPDIPISQQVEIPFPLEKEASAKWVTCINSEPPEISPVLGDYPIVSRFGRKHHPSNKVIKFHKGVDINAPIGTTVVSTSDGEVIDVKMEKTGYGKHITIKHDNSYKTLYAHLSKIDVAKGDMVTKGQKIGEVGASGTTVLPHLHYEVIKEGQKVNPEKYIQM